MKVSATAGKTGDDSTTNDDAAVECYGLRSEVWIEAKKDLEAGDFDKAIFAAFKYIETAIQMRSGLQSIGRGLIDAAFSTKIRIRGSQIDVDSLASFVGGALGFYRGPRAHGATPPVSIATPEQCRRILNIASAILDILDEDENVRPRILALQPSDDSLQILVENVVL